MTIHEPGMPFVDEAAEEEDLHEDIATRSCPRFGAIGVWIETSTCLPPAGTPVLVTLQTPRPCVILAQYAPAKTLPQHADYERGEATDYDEATDTYYAAEGWYQCYAVNGALDDEPFWQLHATVSHWMRLPVPA